MYGGTFNFISAAVPEVGLSPRVRGNLHQACPVRAGRRSIPACTGEPLSVGSSYGSGTVYPRVYGGTGTNFIYPPFGLGLSPRVRGNLDPMQKDSLPGGSIPACTGEPAGHSARASLERVYPRVYGGTCVVSRWPIRQRGLSPRVRGNRFLILASQSVIRSIPACTGEP